jgi:TonB family protein
MTRLLPAAALFAALLFAAPAFADAANTVWAVPVGTHDASAYYPAAIRRLGIEGDVFVQIDIGIDGAVHAAKVVTSSGYDALDEAAVGAVLTWRYVPASRGGVPFVERRNVQVRFVLSSADSLFGSGDPTADTCHGHYVQDPSVRLAACEQLLASATLTDEDHEQVLRNRGAAKFGLGRYDDALVDFDAALKMKPDDAMALESHGMTNYRLGRFDAALADYDRAIALASGRVFLQYERGACLVHLARYSEALTDLDRAVARLPHFFAAYIARSAAQYGLKNYAAAQADAEYVAGFAPTSVEALYARGQARIALGDAAGGKADIAKAQAADPHIADTYLVLVEKP